MASQQLLLGAGGAPADYRFDNYGHWSDYNDNNTQTALTSSNTLTHVHTWTTTGYNSTSSNDYEHPRVKIGGALVSRDTSNILNGYSKCGIALLEGGAKDTILLAHPGNTSWHDMTSSSTVYWVSNMTADIEPTGHVQNWEYLAPILNADSSGQHAVGFGAHRTQMDTTGTNQTPKVHVILNHVDGTGTIYSATQSYNEDNTIQTARYNHAVGSIKHNTAQMFKDQGGLHSDFQQWGGMPKYLAIQNFALSNNSWAQDGKTSPPDNTMAWAFAYQGAHNTHGNLYQGALIGGKSTGGSNDQMMNVYMCWANNHSNGHDGCRTQSFLFDNTNNTYNNRNQQSAWLELDNYGNPPSSGGYGLPVKCIWPHGLLHAITAGDHQVQPGFSNGQNQYIYQDCSWTNGGSYTPKICDIEDENGNDQFGPMCMVAKTATTFTFVALNLVSAKLEMYTYDIANDSMSSKLAASDNTLTTDEESQLTSLHSVPGTNVILGGLASGVMAWKMG